MKRLPNPVGQKIISGEKPEPRKMRDDQPFINVAQPVSQVAQGEAAPPQAPAGRKVLRPTPTIGKKSSSGGGSNKKTTK